MLATGLRNTLHRNGIARDDRRVSLGGAVFHFRAGQHLDCGSWSHIFVAVWHAVDAYGTLMLTPKVLALPHVQE
jgi:hypothetical protein